MPRYLVTYADASIDSSGAREVLSRALAVPVRIVTSDELMRQLGQTPQGTPTVLHLEGVNVSVAELSEAEAARIARDPAIASVEPDFEVRALGERCFDRAEAAIETGDYGPDAQYAGAPPAPWNIEMVRAREVWPRTTGIGIRVGVIDTGIDPNHEYVSVYGGASFVPGVASWHDDEGHGTHVAGIMVGRQQLGWFGVACDAQVYALKVLNANGTGQASWVLQGLDWAVRNRMDVVNLSLGSDVPSANTPYSQPFETAGARLIANGCFIAAAAGNAGNSPNHWVGQPARCPSYMAVGSVDNQRVRSSFSSYGSTLGELSSVEIMAPGSRIRSAALGGGHVTMSGTSMASPHVGGAAALLKQQHPNWSPTQVRDRLKQSALDLGPPGLDDEYGRGLLDCYKAVFPRGIAS